MEEEITQINDNYQSMFQVKSQKEGLEEYKTEISAYKDYSEKISNLEKIKESLRPTTLFYFIVFFVIFLILIYKGGGFWESVVISSIFSFYILLFSHGSDFLANVFSLGKFNKFKKRINEIENLQKGSYLRLQPLEKEISDYCQAQLREFFENNLYKKRSGNQQFEESLSEFTSMIEELSGVNSNFITTHIPLKEYEDYLMKRTIDHSFQTSRSTEKLASVRNFVRDISGAQEQKQKETVTPEKLYRMARKIDNWDEINKKRKITGQKGEEIAMAVEQEFLESIGRKDLADKVRHVSIKDGDGLGYDILSFFVDGREKYIEVKSTTTSLLSSYYLSRNEFEFLKEHPEDAFLYRVLISDGHPQMRADMSLEVLKSNEFIPVQYMVRTPKVQSQNGNNK